MTFSAYSRVALLLLFAAFFALAFGWCDAFFLDVEVPEHGGGYAATCDHCAGVR